MTYHISPRFTADDFSEHWNLEDKIEVFIDRIKGWHLGVANEIIKRDIQGRDLALLHIVASFFEMISKYNSGYLGERKSKEHFRKGVSLVFPDIEPSAEDFINALYKNIRNGLYHIGRPGPNVIFDKNLPGSIGYNSEEDMILVSTDQFVEGISLRFDSYARALRNSANTELRSNFERRFDFDNNLAPRENRGQQ
ncbi:MAG: hypothetical protein HN975_19410 [Anaerolineae bacterium]|jgi:hypothetical protein|nr:hypothetical protein [Anaerolineae bacterium]MBT7073050.1 hypothetical protein [Anaerolineae bacterium]MBT7989677.1 hypothetical protein [Anaerolineae bacterium]